MDDLAATITSLNAQVYDDWRLHVSADPKLDEKGRARLVQWTNADSRIRLHDAHDDADWYGMLDAGDVLTPDALFEMVYYQNRHPQCDLIHSAGWHALSLRRACPAPSRPSKTEGVPPGEVGIHVQKILCSRARPRPHSMSPPPEQPVVVTHAPFPLIELENVRSILIVKLDHLGDVLLTIPAMRRLRELCPEARITALVGSWAKPLVEAEPCIDEMLVYDFFDASSARNCRRLNDADYRQIADLFASQRFDLAIDLRREADTREFLWHSGATYTTGYANRGEHDWLTVAIPWDDVIAVQPPRRHVALDAVRLVEMIALSARADVVTDYRLIGTEDAEANRLLEERLPAEAGLLVGLHPGAGRAIKCWPAERFAQIADRFIDELGATVVLFGTDADARQVDDLLTYVQRRDRLVTLVNQVTLPQFIAILKRFDFFIGNDSGPTHMAAASGIPTLGVYAATIDASQWAPLGPQAAVIQKKMNCSPCYLAKKPDCPYGIACLQEISVEEVWEAVLRVSLPKWSRIKSVSSLAAALGAAR
jgi:lipopolysaccharide heptosyltransferase II